MDGKTFVEELSGTNEKILAEMGSPETPVEAKPGAAGLETLLRVALANEISVAELAAFWIPSVSDWEIKIALAKQAGDEAGHFQLVEDRLKELGLSLIDFQPPPVNPLFEFLRGLRNPVERIAAGMFTLESIAYRVNDGFLRYCERAGDLETAKIYRERIQPDELRHHQLGGRLLRKYAATEESQRRARAAAARTLEIARQLRLAAKRKMGVSCLPGC